MIQLIINEEHIGERIDKVIPALLSDFSRSKVQSLIENKKIFVNENVVKSSYKVELEDEITIYVEEVDTSIKAEDIPLDVCYEDDDVIVINKDQGAKTVIKDLNKVSKVEVLEKHKGFFIIKCIFD